MSFNEQSLTDEHRLQRIAQQLTRHQTDVRRLWERIGQMPDSMGMPLAGQQSVSIPYTPAAAPTTTGSPTTSRTTTLPPETIYLYPFNDRYSSIDWQMYGESRIWECIGDSDSFPDDASYIHLPETYHSSFQVYIDPPFPFTSLVAVEVELYCKNEILADLISFTAKLIGDGDQDLTTEESVTGVGNGEAAFTLRTVPLSLLSFADSWSNWSLPQLYVDAETNNDAGSPDFYISAARVKLTVTHGSTGFFP